MNHAARLSRPVTSRSKSLLQATVAATLVSSVFAAPCAIAGVTSFDVQSRQADAFEGRVFGASGVAEKISGSAVIALDPADAHNAGIVDLALAPRNAAGKVEARADVVIVRPAKPNGTMIVEVPNRGRKLIGAALEGSSVPDASRQTKAADAGNGFLLSQGYTLAWVGWQADVPKGADMRLDVPTVAGVTGPSRDEWIFTKASPTERVTLAYPMATQDGARLTVRAQRKDARATPADLAFRVIDANTLEITRPAAMPVDAIYEFTYTARDPKVMGMAFAALRDVTAFLAHDTSSANPLADAGKPTVSKTIGLGISQSGRLMRDYLYQGFNQDEAGRKVFDGVMVQIPGGRRTATNTRFAQLSRNPGPHADDLYPVDQFPAAYETSTDPLTGNTAGLLKSCRETNTCPRVIQMDSEYEFWSSHASKVVTDGNARDLPLPAEARAYLVVGTQHFPAPYAQAMATCSLPVSPVDPAPVNRALLTALNAWITNGTEPPASRYPTVARGTLVPAQGLYPAIPGLPYKGVYGEARLIVDGSPLPLVKGEYPLLMPAVDKDGNGIDGVRLPIIDAARATYVGWNPKSNNPDGLCTQQGSSVPFAATRAEREVKQDPRLSIEERYPRQAAYEAAAIASANALVRARLLLPEDAKAAIEDARAGKLDRLTK